jgi:hypothetical protein
MTRTVIVCVLYMLGLVGGAGAQQAMPSQFIGTWVGTQSWAIETPPPNAKTPQPVELTIESVDGKLVGVMTPFFGGSDGARFTDSQITGEQLKTTAVMGRPTGWKTTVRINFDFKSTGDRNALIGTADVFMGDTKWTTFKYELSRKRSRY